MDQLLAMLTKSAPDLCAKNGTTEKYLPPDSVYATKTNIGRMAINEGIFYKYLIENHSRDVEKLPQDCTICIMASDLRLKKGGTWNIYDTMPELV